MRMTASWFRSPRINRIQGRGAISAPDGELPSDLSPAAPRAGQFDHQQSLPVRPGTAKKGRAANEEMVASLVKQGGLTSIAPYKGFGCRPSRRAQMHWGRRPKASREGNRGTLSARSVPGSPMGI